MQKDNAALVINLTHRFMKKGDALSPNIASGAVAGLNPTAAELDSAFGQTAAQINTVVEPFIAIFEASGTLWFVIAYNDSWFYEAMTLAM